MEDKFTWKGANDGGKEKAISGGEVVYKLGEEKGRVSRGEKDGIYQAKNRETYLKQRRRSCGKRKKKRASDDQRIRGRRVKT